LNALRYNLAMLATAAYQVVLQSSDIIHKCNQQSSKNKIIYCQQKS
jgi:hypothetical protein